MTNLDVEELLNEVDTDNPVGDDLEYDPEFSEMESLATSGNMQSMVELSEEDAADAVDWKGVQKKALALLARSKDLRLAVYLARSSIVCDGLQGFCDALALLQGMLDRYWDQVHPQLDPEDDNDPTMRVNIIATLSAKADTLDLLASAPLVVSQKVGTYGFKAYQIASGQLPAPEGDDSVPDLALISAAFQDCDLATLQSTGAVVGESIEHVKAVDATLMDKVGSSRAADLQPLLDTLESMHRLLSEQLAIRGVNTEVAEGGDSQEGEPGTAAAFQGFTGEITRREDAMRMMDSISNYFRAHEPSSPIPLLMQRAKRLSSMDFLDILKDLAPDGVSQAENIAGQPGSPEEDE